MVRIIGVNIPTDKKVEFSLRYIKGIGPAVSKKILAEADVSGEKRVFELTDSEVQSIRDVISKYEDNLGGALESKVKRNIKKLVDMGCYRGRRHRTGLPVRGQRTSTNARTRKGKAVAVAGKKK